MAHQNGELPTRPLTGSYIISTPPSPSAPESHDDRPLESRRPKRDRIQRSRQSMSDEESWLSQDSEDDENIMVAKHSGAYSLRMWSERIREFSRVLARPATLGYRRISDFTLHSIHETELDNWTSRIPSKSSVSRIRLAFICTMAGSVVVIVICIAGRLRGTRHGSITMSDEAHDPSSPPVMDVASPIYHLFDRTALQTKGPASASMRLRTPRHLSATNGCLEKWFASGVLCNSDIGPQDELDLIYLWVNGSDPIWHEQYELTREEDFSRRDMASDDNAQPPVRHYRSQGSFKYALRSGVESFRKDEDGAPSWLRKVHVLTADMPVPSDEDQDPAKGDYRLGQIPDWLDKERVFGVTVNSILEIDLCRVEQDKRLLPSSPPIQWHFHSEVFTSPADGFSDAAANRTKALQGDWSTQALPTFNSFAIEIRIPWLDDLADNGVQANDDMFFGRPLSSADFHSTLYGSVFRLDQQFGLRVQPMLMPSKISDNGEWGGLQHANWLISQRFPNRPRNYLDHLPKSLSAHILQEASIAFALDLNDAALRHFRESRRGVGDVSMAFLATHMRIERWREALLWSWAIAKVGSADGVWGYSARRQLRHVLGVESLEGEKVRIRRAARDTLKDVESNFRRAGWEPPLATEFRFSSMDGHLPRLPDFRLAHDDVEECELNMDDCFGSAFLQGEDVDAGDMFKRIAFEQFQCGDCLIMALVNKSGRRGLSAFLPDHDQTVKVDPLGDEALAQPPHLPLTATWTTTDFSVTSVVDAAPGRVDDGQVDLRTWVMLLLSRYTYMSGNSASHFASLKQPFEAVRTFAHLRANPELGMICLNDDEDAAAEEQIGTLLHEWLEERWGTTPAWWERQVAVT